MQYQGVDEPAPADPEAVQAQAKANLRIAMSVLDRDDDLVTWLSDRLVAIAGSVPDEVERLPSRRALAPRYSATGGSSTSPLPGEHVEEAGREGAEPGRPGRLGVVRELARAARLRPAAVHRGLRRPGRVHQHRRVRAGLRRLAGHRLVRAEREPDRRPAADRDHRVHQRRAGRRAGHGQPGRRPVRRSSTGSGARAPRTARSPTSSTGRCGCSASWPRTASSRSARCCGSRVTRARRRPRTRAPTSASSRSA